MPIPFRKLVVTFGDWLSNWDWEWFLALTFPDELIGPKKAHSYWVNWLRSLQRSLGHKVNFVRVTDFRWPRGGLHYHGVMLDVGNARRLRFMDLWTEISGGWGRIMPYEQNKRGCHYLGKKYYMWDGDIVFSDGFRKACSKKNQLTLPI